MNWGDNWNNNPAANAYPNHMPDAQSAINTTGVVQPTYADAVPKNPLDAMSQDELLILWNDKKKALEYAKNDEMTMRKYIVGRAFPNATEGVNNLNLGNGYTLKAGVKFNYKLADNKVVESCLDRIALTGNIGPFIAERLVSWTPNFLKTEYTNLQEQAKDGDKTAIDILKIINDEMLTIDKAAPTLEIKEPKSKKK